MGEPPRQEKEEQAVRPWSRNRLLSWESRGWGGPAGSAPATPSPPPARQGLLKAAGPVSELQAQPARPEADPEPENFPPSLPAPPTWPGSAAEGGFQPSTELYSPGGSRSSCPHATGGVGGLGGAGYILQGTWWGPSWGRNSAPSSPRGRGARLCF